MQRAKALGGNGKVEYVELENGERLKTDAVILGIGVRPNIKLAQEAGWRWDLPGQWPLTAI